MKVIMMRWAGEAMTLPEWWHEDCEEEVSMSQIETLYETGLNVMLKHATDKTVLAVDTKAFTQR